MALSQITLSLLDDLSNPLVEGTPWEVYFSVDDSTPIKTIKGTDVYVSNPILDGNNNPFSVDTGDNSINGYNDYVTWRSSSPDGQHPTYGWSLDIWNQTFANNIITYNSDVGMTWNEILTGNGSGGNTYPLSSTKYSLMYNYDNSYPPFFSKGGLLTVTSVIYP